MRTSFKKNYLTLLFVLVLTCPQLSSSVATADDITSMLEKLDSSSLISPEPPPDPFDGAKEANLISAGAFAWETFIALNWPALEQNGKVVRDTPDTKALFGPRTSAPLVWQTFRNKVEIFPGTNSPTQRPHGNKAGDGPANRYGYDDPPQYIYANPGQPGQPQSIPACPGQAPVTNAPWINLDETSQIELARMYAGVLGGVEPSPLNSAPQQVRFLAKANYIEYQYVIQNNLWYSGDGTPLEKKIKIWQTGIASNSVPDPDAVVTLPIGTFEVKSAWRPLAPGEDRGRFHTARVRYYEPSPGPGGNAKPCYREDEWALIALHIIEKTPTSPNFIFATFEQADNLLLPDGRPVEDTAGNIMNNPADSRPTTPPLTYADSPTNPQVTTVPPDTFCTDVGKRLYFRELPAVPSATNPHPGKGTPVGGNICVNSRYEPIGNAIAFLNNYFHDQINDYLDRNNVPNTTDRTPWIYYKLVNVQTVPFDEKSISTNTTSTRRAGNYFQANIVVETDYTLQQFVGRIADDQAPTLYPEKGSLPNFHNVYVPNGSGFSKYQMGGCMGCHGNAQFGGTDFSFILGSNNFNIQPDVPEPDDSTLAMKQQLYRSLFAH